MVSPRGLLWLLAVVGASSAHAIEHKKVKCDGGASLVAETTSARVQGFINGTTPNVRQWLGVPYAEPPVGDLRFEPPVRKRHAGPIDTTKWAPTCIQALGSMYPPVLYQEQMGAFLLANGQNEDCLYLNVFAPLNPTAASLPVIIFLPGGELLVGGADTPYLVPAQWVERTQDHIAITINYRVNVFGFPNAKAQQQNVGLLDQRMVIEWARDNVAAFGGDPSHMVLWGQSAGSTSTNFYAYSYPNDPIVSGFIADSGAVTIQATNNTSGSDFTTLAGMAGCGDLQPQQELQCMQGLNATYIQQVYGTNPNLTFEAIADNITAPQYPAARLAEGLVSRLPFIMGNNANESTTFCPYTLAGPQHPQELLLGLEVVSCPVVEEIAQRAKFGYTTYRYEYAGNFSNITPLPWIGATHSAELPLVMGTHPNYNSNSTPLEWDTSSMMQDLWVAFAANTAVDPVAQGYTWEKYSPNTTSMALFAANGTVVQSVPGSYFDFQCDGVMAL